jgi:hypothetical protein
MERPTATVNLHGQHGLFPPDVGVLGFGGRTVFPVDGATTFLVVAGNSAAGKLLISRFSSLEANVYSEVSTERSGASITASLQLAQDNGRNRTVAGFCDQAQELLGAKGGRDASCAIAEAL